ncbi:MAG: ABC transporter permease [Microscillaceae bacterium]|nr:ABC transporter permease [Microscillaceae bacterium]
MPERSKQKKDRKPLYYVRKRLFSNIPAVFGMLVILISVIISILGYSIMPDNTPYADGRADQISKQPPGFKVLMLNVRKNLDIKYRKYFERVLFGQESEYRSIPIENYTINTNNLTIEAQIYGEKDKTVLPLVDVVKPLYVGKSEKLDSHESGNYYYDASTQTIIYLDLHEKLNRITKSELLNEFEAHCLETRTYLLGTDKSGRDMLSRLLFGVRISLGIGLISVAISFVVGFTLGSLAGFFGGWIDSFILWFMTVVWSIPGIMLVIAISLALGRGVLVAFVAIGLTTWVEIARVVRGQILSVKQKQYVEAAKAVGMGSFRIITVHILPNIIGPLIVILTSNFASAILTEAGLSFLGLSAQPPMASWGVMVNEGFGFITTTGGFYLVLFPSLCIALMVLAFNLFGNGLRDAYDPKTSTK